MIGLYRELARLHREDSLDFSRVLTFNLDEYLGISPTHPHSFHHFMLENFFSHVNIDPRNVHIPDGTITGDYEKYCASYEEEIQRAGGIDLQILGIGRNGHIGFNEPTSSFASKTRLKVLSKATMDDNRKFFSAGETVPRCAITMGIGTILATRRVLMLATGSAKAAAVANAIEGPITSSVTASALQLHRRRHRHSGRRSRRAAQTKRLLSRRYGNDQALYTQQVVVNFPCFAEQKTEVHR